MGNNPPGIVNMGDTAYYAYQLAGSFNITLTATNSVGCTGTATLPINVLAAPFAILATVPDPAVGCSPFPVVLNGSGFPLPPYNIPIDSLQFSYSDDNTSETLVAGSPANHTFIGEGTFYAELVTIDEF